MKKVVLIFIFLFPFFLNAQGLFIPKGDNGLLINGTRTFNKKSWSYGFYSGFSLNGTLDLGLNYSRVSQKDDNISGQVFLPVATVYFLKESYFIPYTFYFNVAYTLGKFKNFDDGKELELLGLILGGGIGFTVFKNNYFQLIPYGGIHFYSLKSNINFPPKDFKSYTIGMALSIDFIQSISIVVDGGYGLTDSNESYSISGGFLYTF